MQKYYLPGGMVVTEDKMGNTTWFRPRREQYEEAAKTIGCLSYRQCPVCYKCINKSAHLYEQCKNCKVDWCHHKQDDRAKLIKPKNFYLAGQELKESMSNEYHRYLFARKAKQLFNLELTDEVINDILKTYKCTIQAIINMDNDTLEEIFSMLDKGE